MYVVLAGSLFEGLKTYGPFEDAEKATNWAINNVTSRWEIFLMKSEV